MAVPVLSLTTIVEYPTVAIDQALYRLTPPDAFSLFARLALEEKEKRLQALIAAPERSKSDEEEIIALLDTICREVLEAPAAIHDKLRDTQRLLVVEAFIVLPQMSRRTPAATPETASASPSSGAKSSRGSRGSTTAVRASGSTTRRTA